MNELDLIRSIRRWAGESRQKGVTLGIGDDCAIYQPKGAADDLLFTTDLMIEDVHFLAGVHRASDIGWKALARSLSDIAAMGGTPVFCLVSLALAPWLEQAAGGPQGWLREFYRGLLALAQRYQVTLAGGDLAHAAAVSVDVMVCGRVPAGKALRRDTAQADDLIYVSGRLGGAALGLETRAGTAWRRHLRPEPRLALGQHLRAKICATACIDLSDGLSLDLHRLAEASRLRAVLHRPPPAFRGASIGQSLDGGDDYELLFTAPASRKVPARVGGIPITCIGRMETGRAGEVEFAGQPLAPRGYDHFRKDVRPR